MREQLAEAETIAAMEKYFRTSIFQNIMERYMTYYCHLDTSGGIGATNLQLYSLQQAAKYWNELHGRKSDHEFSGVEDLIREQCAFTLSILGLSLSQLLGQNRPSPSDKIDPPETLLRSLLRDASVDRTKRRSLEHTFAEFITYYDAIRHFGKNKNERHYRTLDQLTSNELDRFARMTIEIWDIVIAMYRNDPENDIDEFKSISEVVGFDDLFEKCIDSSDIQVDQHGALERH